MDDGELSLLKYKLGKLFKYSHFGKWEPYILFDLSELKYHGWQEFDETHLGKVMSKCNDEFKIGDTNGEPSD